MTKIRAVYGEKCITGKRIKKGEFQVLAGKTDDANRSNTSKTSTRCLPLILTRDR